jgi:DNA-binding winged helix-turn-helix (wHTH) protein
MSSSTPKPFRSKNPARSSPSNPSSIKHLLFLIQNRSRAIGKDELLSNVWEDVAVTDNALARVVAQLRKALGNDAKIARYIETVPTIGYRFVAEVVELAAADRLGSPERAPRNLRWPLAAAVTVALLAIGPAAIFWQRSRSTRPPLWSGTSLGGSTIASHARISPDRSVARLPRHHRRTVPVRCDEAGFLQLDRSHT